MSNDNQSSGEEDAYEDRNLAVLAYLKSQYDLKQHLESSEYSYGGDFGWKEAPDEDNDEWVIVWIDWAGENHQQSWHMRRELVEDLDWLPKNYVKWDGHTREQKNNRLRHYIGLPVNSETR